MKNENSYLIPDRPIAFNREFVAIGCGIKGALMLSQAVYWAKRTSEDGWFYKTQKEWQEETGMTPDEQKSANRRLKKLGFIVIKKRGLPAKNYYKVNIGKILEEMKKVYENNEKKPLTSERKPHSPVRGKATHWWGDNPPTSERKSHPHSITESTTESTTEREPTQISKNKIEKKTREFVEEVKKTIGNVNDIRLTSWTVYELQKFVSYWTEPNKSRTKIRWELQRTWDTNRRIRNWLRKASEYQKTNNQDNKYSINPLDL